MRRTFGKGEGKREGSIPSHHPTLLAEDGIAQQVGAKVATVGFPWSGRSLIAPFFGGIILAPVGNVGSGLLLDFRDTICNRFALKKPDSIALAGIDAVRGMKSCVLLVAIKQNVLMAAYGMVGQLPGLCSLIADAELILAEIHSRGTSVIEFHPRIGKLIQIVHHTVDVRLHELINDELGIAGHGSAKHCRKEKQEFFHTL